MTESEAQRPQAGGGKTRQFVLLGILLLLVVGLIYDYRVARPNVDQAYEKIAEKSMLVNMSSTEIFTNKDVQELLGKEPSRSFDEPNGDRVEVYSWRSGLPIRTHDLFAVFKKNGENWLFHRHAKFKHEASDAVSPYDLKDNIVILSEPEELTPEQMDAAGGGGYGGGPGGGGPDGGGEAGDSEPGADGQDGGEPGAGGPGGGRNFDPEAMFNERDADGDGLLAGDEIPERARENLAEIDTDGDEAISKEEWTARVESMRARSGGGGEARPRGERSRPELESAEPEEADAEPADAEPADAEPADAEPADAEPADADEPAPQVE